MCVWGGVAGGCGSTWDLANMTEEQKWRGGVLGAYGKYALVPKGPTGLKCKRVLSWLIASKEPFPGFT